MKNRTQRGFSIVELMVAMALSLVLLAGVLAVLYSSKVTYAENERLARNQENARVATEMILRDMRSGGFQGCGRPLVDGDLENLLVDPTALTRNFLEPLRGFEGSGGADADAEVAFGAPLEDGDSVVIRGVRPGFPSFRLAADPVDGESPLAIEKPAGFSLPAGTPLLVSNCERGSIFATSSAIGAGTAIDIHHETGATGGLENSLPDLGGGYSMTNTQVSPLNTIAYYVKADASGIPSLWRMVDDDVPAEPIIPGVERIEILYGVDNDGDLRADEYVSADAVADWNAITAASISVLVRSADEYGSDKESREFDMLGTAVGPFNDRYQRTVFTTTASLRNRIP